MVSEMFVLMIPKHHDIIKSVPFVIEYKGADYKYGKKKGNWQNRD